MKKVFTAVIAAMTLALSFPSYAQEQVEPETQVKPETQVGDVIYDVLLMRPFGVIAVGVGAAAFVISLPIAFPLGEAGRTADELIVAPFNYTFTRPIGDVRRGQIEKWEKERAQEYKDIRRRYPSRGVVEDE